MGKQQQIVVLFGNPNPQMTREVRDEAGNVVQRVQYPHPFLNQSVTRVVVPGLHSEETTERALSTDNDRQLMLVARALGEEHRRWALHCHEAEQIMAVHSAGVAPAWVSCPDVPGLERALAAHFGCARGEPTALITNGGRDALHHQHLDTAAQPASFTYGALTANSTAPASGDTSLTGEIATAGGGLIRAQMTFAHTAGTNTSTLTHTWTANGSDSLPVTVAKWANFNASSSGTMGEEDLLSATATLSASGDSVTVTFTATIG